MAGRLTYKQMVELQGRAEGLAEVIGEPSPSNPLDQKTHAFWQACIALAKLPLPDAPTKVGKVLSPARMTRQSGPSAFDAALGEGRR